MEKPQTRWSSTILILVAALAFLVLAILEAVAGEVTSHVCAVGECGDGSLLEIGR
jgi:hypothetical protein